MVLAPFWTLSYDAGCDLGKRHAFFKRTQADFAGQGGRKLCLRRADRFKRPSAAD
jgi:hypothetical protein